MKNHHIELFLQAKYKIISIFLTILASVFQFLGLGLIYPFIVIFFDLKINIELIQNLLNYLENFGMPTSKYWLLFYVGSCILFTAIINFAYRILISISAFDYLGRLRLKILNYFLKSKFHYSSEVLSKFKNSKTLKLELI